MVYFSLFKEELFYQGTFLRIVEFLIHFVALIGIRNMILKEEQYFDERTTSMSDYSIIVSNLPQTMGNRLRLQKLFQNEFGMTFGSGTSQIKEMIYVFKDHQLQQLGHKGKQLQAEILESINSKDIHKVQQLEKQLLANKRQQQTLVKALHQRIAKDQIKCIKMIVVFNTESDKASVIQSYKATIQNGHDYNHYFSDTELKHQRKTHIVFKQAPQPNQIIWQHIDESDSDRKALILKGYGLTFIFLAIITVFFYFILLGKTRLFISAIQRQLHNPQDQTAKTFKAFATAIVFVAIFGVVLFNKFIMGQVLHKIVHSQRHAYTDRQNHSFSIKYALGMFFTTALMTLAVEAITFRNFYSHEYGVIEEQTIMFFVTAFLIPLVWLIHPFNLARKFKLWRSKNTLVSQEKANLLSQDVAYDLGKRYAEVFEIMWFTFLYSQLIPLGSFLVLVGLFLYFWVDKLNFLRRSAIKTGISGKMAILALKSLDATLFLAPAGQLLFDWILRSKFDYLSFVFALIGIAYLFVPISEIIWYFNSEKFFLEKRTYEEVKYSFKETYYTLHPVYRLAFADKIKKYKQKYRQSSIQELKSIKIFGTGRGTYQQIRYTPDEKTSRITTFPSIEDIHKSRFLGTLLK